MIKSGMAILGRAIMLAVILCLDLAPVMAEPAPSPEVLRREQNWRPEGPGYSSRRPVQQPTPLARPAPPRFQRAQAPERYERNRYYEPRYETGRPYYRRPEYTYDEPEVYVRGRYGRACETSRGVCYVARPQPLGSGCRCEIRGFGLKRGNIEN